MFGKPTCEGLGQKFRKFGQAEAVCKEAEAALTAQLSLESIISKASRRFLSLTDLDRSINTCLAEIGHFCAADRAYIFQFTSDGSIMNNTHEWCAPGVRSEIESLQALSINMFPWWMKILKAGENIHVQNVTEMPPEARAEKEILEAQNIKSVLVVPFLVEKRLAGFLGFDNVASTRVWDGRELVPLRTLAEIIGTAVTRRRSEEALRHNEELLQLFVKHTPAAVAMCDRQMRYLSYSDRWAQDYGLGEENFVGFCHYDLFPDLPTHWKKEHQMCFDGEVIKKDVEPFPRKDGSMDWVRRELCPWHHRSGDIGGLIMFTEVITDKIRLEDQLRQSQKMEAIGTLAGGIAHNFNNLLMGIQGRTSLLMFAKDQSHPDYENLRGITESVRSAAELTKDLLGFARGGKYEPKITDLNALIRNENRIFSRMTKEIRIHEKYEKKLWPAEVDRGQIQQTLLNLNVNAWQAMPGGGDLYIQTGNVIFNEPSNQTFAIKAGRYVKISVTDTGIGMDDAILDKIFEPFFTTKNKSQSSGLGLASAYGIVKNHGGFIDVHSQKGKGSTFTIYLPASITEPVKDSLSLGLDQPEIQHGKGSILLVDDEDNIIDVGQEMLKSIGYQVLIAQSGREALDVYRKQKGKIDLVLLDMIMPDMGGGETYDRLKNIDERVTVILSSGYSINGEARKILSRGCNGFIQKPYTLQDLSIKLKQTLEGNRRGG